MKAFSSEKKTMAVLAFLLLAGSAVLLTAAAHAKRNNPRFPHQSAQQPVPGMKEVPTGTLEDLAEFKTHLPIVVLEFTDGEPKRHAMWDDSEQISKAVEEDPFASGYFRLYYNDYSPNTLSDRPIIETRIRARLRGFSSLAFPKKQYLIKMETDTGAENHVDVLGMGAEWEWILNISQADKSLLRNYMAYTLAGELMEYAPEARYCEAFRKREDQYEYLGVYLIMESIKRGKNRLPLTKYEPHHAQTAFLVCRNRFDLTALMLDTYGTVHGLTDKIVSLRYPRPKKVTRRTINYVEKEISRFEEALFSKNTDAFLAYREMVDLDTFVDYFIINEFLMNYDSMTHSFYAYQHLEGKLRLGPVWDFDCCLGNNMVGEIDPEKTPMRYGQWLKEVARDGKFVRMAQERYTELRQDKPPRNGEPSKAAGLFSDSFMENFIDEVIAYLGDARIRDWNRWRYDDHQALRANLDREKREYVPPPLLRNTRNFEEEIEFMKNLIRVHGAVISRNLNTMYDGRNKYLDDREP